MSRFQAWLAPGVGVKRWALVALVGIVLISLGISSLLVRIGTTRWLMSPAWSPLLLLGGGALVFYGLRGLVQRLLRPYGYRGESLSQSLYTYSQRGRGPQVVAMGGGTGLPSVLRGLKTHTNNITAVVTVADDGGSSGRLREDMGVLPPGDLRNNIVALADDESLMSKLFQYRFSDGELKGHAFGNLFISALASVTEGGLETALAETGEVLKIQGRVLPSTMQNVNLRASVRMPGKSRTLSILGESAISDAGGQIEHLDLVPGNAAAYPTSVEAIMNADLIVIGPGSLYTSILPNLLVKDIADALRATEAYIIYVCNVATQPGETTGYTVADHVLAMENHIGRGVFQAVLANNHFPPPPSYSKTVYVEVAPAAHQVLQRYELIYTDLTDDERPWRHDPAKLGQSLIKLYREERTGRRDKHSMKESVLP